MHEFFLSTENRKLVVIVAQVFQSRGEKYLYLLYFWNGIFFNFIHFVCNHGFDCFVHAFIR